MKVALLLPGQIREAKDTFPFIKGRIIDRFKADVFISSWNPSEELKHSLHADSRHLTDSLSIDEICKIYKPKKFSLDNFESRGIKLISSKAQSYEVFTPMNGEMNPVSVFLMWFKIKQAFKLLEEYESISGEKYDYVIKGRFDIKIHNDVVLDKNLNTICIPPGYDWRGGINDILAFGGREAMEWYCSMFDYLEEYILSGIFFHPETLLRHHLVNSGFNVDRPDLKVSLRGNNIWEKNVVSEKIDKKSFGYIESKGNIWDT